jgi:hypothetical protein
MSKAEILFLHAIGGFACIAVLLLQFAMLKTGLSLHRDNSRAMPSPDAQSPRGTQPGDDL